MIYQLAKGNVVHRLSDNAFIPFDPANTDYQAYLAWLEEGNEPLLPEEAPITWESIRAKRDQLIRESDWTMIPGATVDQSQWAAYRQILRDLPQTYAASGPESVVWPTQPSTAGPNTTPVE
jgi:hypothetical protein